MDKIQLDKVTRTRLKASLDSIADFHSALVDEVKDNQFVDPLALQGLLSALDLEAKFALDVIAPFFAPTADNSYPEPGNDDDELLRAAEELGIELSPQGGMYGGRDK